MIEITLPYRSDGCAFNKSMPLLLSAAGRRLHKKTRFRLMAIRISADTERLLRNAGAVFGAGLKI